MLRTLITVIFGAIFATATLLVVVLYWLMILIFAALQVLTFPVQWIWRGIRRAV